MFARSVSEGSEIHARGAAQGKGKAAGAPRSRNNSPRYTDRIAETLPGGKRAARRSGGPLVVCKGMKPWYYQSQYSVKEGRMRRKVERLSDMLVDAFKKWDGVQAVVLGEASEEDILDPYFTMVIDVYHHGAIPGAAERKAAFGDPGAFEPSAMQDKDRFFLEELPIHVEYKTVASVDEILQRKFDLYWVFTGSGTYMFYRLEHGSILYDRDGWMESVRKQIKNFPAAFWKGLRDTFQSKMEHYLADLGAAAVMGDVYFYMVSMVGFLRYAAASLFMINHRFEPSNRSLSEQLKTLPILPEEFWGRWENLMCQDGCMGPDKRFQIAQLLALSLFSLKK
jgi:hypothetical protein